jgi:hypothetical protein
MKTIHHSASKTTTGSAHLEVGAEELQDRIRERAFELYEQRGCQDGRELDDWLQAEAETTRQEVATAA